MFQHPLQFCALALTFAAVHTTTVPTSQVYVTNFDKIPTNGINAVPVPIPIDGLFLGRFAARPDGINLQKARSPPNAAGFSGTRQVADGGPPANITVIYPNTKVKYFNLVSTYLGCSVDATAGVVNGIIPQALLPSGTAPNAAVSIPCQVLFQGTNSKGQPISQTCSYSGTINGGLEQCVFGPQFGDANTLEISIASSLAAGKATTVAAFDDIVHENFFGWSLGRRSGLRRGTWMLQLRSMMALFSLVYIKR